jgi:hypothetical protein
MKGRREMMGRMMSETMEVATAVNADAKLLSSHVSFLASSFESICLYAHQTNCDFEHIVSKSELPKAVPRHLRGVRDIVKVDITVSIIVKVIHKGGHCGVE